MSGRLERSIGLAALCLLAAALLAVGVAQWLAARAVPPPFQHVVPHATGYAVTGPLRDLWRHVPTHLERVFSQAASEEGKGYARIIENQLTALCLNWADLSDLRKLGMDETRGAALSLIDWNNVVAAVPIVDPDRFVAFLERVTRQHRLQLSVPPGKVATAIRVDPAGSTGVLGCARDGKPIDLSGGSVLPLTTPPNPDEPQEQTVDVVVARAGAGPGEIRLRCSAVFADGTTGDCRCKSVPGGADCAASAWKLERIETGDTDIARLKSVSKPKLRMPVHILDDRVAIVGGDVQFVRAAANSRENLAFFRGDDTFLAAWRHITQLTEHNHGLVAGAASVNSLPFNGRAHFAVAFGPGELTARALVPWQTLKSRLLEQLVAAVPPRTGANAPPLSGESELRIDDPALGDYLRVIEAYGDPSQQALKRLGHFEVFLRQFMGLKEIGPFRLAARGVQDGVPNIVMALGVASEDARKMLLTQRIRMRKARDTEILVAAATRFIASHPDDTLVEIAQLVKDQYLRPEAGALWERYRIERPLKGKVPDSWDAVFRLQPDLKGDDFETAEYNVVRDGRRLQYVPPPITDNDILYRVKSDPAKKIDEAALKAGRFRLAAYIDDANRRLLIASDMNALAQVAGAAPVQGAGGAASTPVSGKIGFFGDPRFLVNQGLLYPERGISDFVRRYFMEFEQYRTLKLTIDPLPSRLGIGATIVLGHE